MSYHDVSSNNQFAQVLWRINMRGPVRAIMSVYYYEPFTDFDRLFDEAFSARAGNGQVARTGETGAAVNRFLRPSMDLLENKEKNTLTATFELPGLQLPQGVKDTDIKASMENGVLSVTFPKSTPDAAPKKIAIA